MNLDLVKNLTSQKVKIENLLLNPNNPRLMGKNRNINLPDIRVSEAKVQESIIQDIRSENIIDLYEKIRTMGFLSIDRVVVRKNREDDNSFIVLEGNRRVTTAKILLKEHSEGKISLEDNVLKSINEIEVLVYSGDDKNIIWLLQGMRHINGIKEWGALQQAKFLVEMQSEDNLSATVLQQMTGLGRNKISNKIRAYKGYEFSQENYHGDLSENHFSLFSEAIFDKKVIKDWLDWDDATSEFNNLENLENLLNWYVGDENGRKRIERVLDIRDGLSKLLLQNNASIFNRFVDNEIGFEEAISEVNSKEIKKKAQDSQTDISERLSALNDFLSSISTLPMRAIKTSADKSKFEKVLRDIRSEIDFHIEILEK